MKLPNASKVIISREKLTDYVLSETHSTGRFKAKFFRSLGFNEANVSLFVKALHTIANSEEIKEVSTTMFGAKYVIDGKINTPSGKVVKIRTIWIIEQDQKEPRFVTVYPV